MEYLIDLRSMGVRELSTREIQLELFSMLRSLSEVFDEHGIRYSLDGGTLLGAVRHKGFIPWDDDIDILVPRPDFDLLLNNPDWCPDGMMLEGMGINGNPLPFLKLANPKFRAQEAAYEGAFEEHLWVDIFPADSMPQDLNERAGLMRKQQKQQKAAARSVINIDAAISASRGVIKKSLKKFYLPIYKATHSSLYEYQKLTDTARATQFGSTEEIGNVVWGPYKQDKPGFPVEDFNNLVELEFEGHVFKACRHWDDYLTRLYGDYMQLPPADQRVTHGMKVWALD